MHLSRISRYFCLTLSLALVLSASQAMAREALKGPQAKYVFLFIGDGFAQAQRAAAEFYMAAQASEGKPGIVKLEMNKLPVQGATTTYSANSIITDSGAAGTALACGVKTYNGAIGVDMARKPVESMAETAKKLGMKVGIVSSVSIDHATPASFYSHEVTRNNYYEIAQALPESGFDYFAGGGFKDPAGKRSKKEGDKINAYEYAATKGYKVLSDKASFASLKPGSGKVYARNPNLDHDAALPYQIDASPEDISLAEFTAKGIELLDNPKGFFMMVEGGKIDWACHANDAASAIIDTLAFDDAVKQAVQFAQKHPEDTLIVVTGDHECGGMALGFAGTRYGNYYEYLKNQKMSFQAFTNKLADYKKNTPMDKAQLEDILPSIADAFGLRMPTQEEQAEMTQHPVKPNEDITSPKDPFGMYFKPHELAMLKESFARTMADEKDRSKDDDAYLRYGGYEPLTVTLTHILNAKAGIGWTTYAHTGMPVVTTASGPAARPLAGYLDNTELSKLIVSAMAAKQVQKTGM